MGQVVAGRFKVLEKLGSGTAGDVYVAEHADLGRRYAIKVLKETVEADHTMVERFRREARAAGRLDHPNIVYITDFGRMEDGRLFLVMEHVPGQTLQGELRSTAPRKMARARALSILRQIADALRAAHEAGVVHRDIKPGNILLAKAPDGGDRVKILDFGLAKIMIESELTALTARGEMFGTPAYMSPEQARGEDIDGRTDLYALGVIGFQLLTGQLPFASKSIPQMMLAHQRDPVPDPQSLLGPGEPPLPMELTQVLLECLAKDPAHRPATADVLLSAIDGLDASQHASTVTMPVVQDPAMFGHHDAGAHQVVAAPPDAQAVGEATTLAEESFEVVKTVLEHEADGTTRRAWALEQAAKVGRSMAAQMIAFGLGDSQLHAALSELERLEAEQIGLETQLAVYRARLEEQEVRFRERVARLRYAVTDLSVERGRAQDAGADPAVAVDIAYQISELEKRLGEVSREEEAEQGRVVAGMRVIQKGLAKHSQTVSAADRRLIGMLYQARPEPCPPQFLREYDSLDLLMKAAFGA